MNFIISSYFTKQQLNEQGGGAARGSQFDKALEGLLLRGTYMRRILDRFLHCKLCLHFSQERFWGKHVFWIVIFFVLFIFHLSVIKQTNFFIWKTFLNTNLEVKKWIKQPSPKKQYSFIIVVKVPFLNIKNFVHTVLFYFRNVLRNLW